MGCTEDIIITGGAGGIGPFRYVLLYDDTSATDVLIGYWDYGQSITVGEGETFTIDPVTSIFTLAASA